MEVLVVLVPLLGVYLLGRRHGRAVHTRNDVLDPVYEYRHKQWSVFIDNAVWTPSGVYLARGASKQEARARAAQALRALAINIETENK